MLALVGVTQLAISGVVWIWAAVALTAVATALPRVLSLLQKPLVKLGPGFLIVFILGDLLTSGGDVLPSLLRIIAGIVLYRALEFRTPRQDRQLILLALVLVLLTGTLEASLLFAAQFLVFVPLAMWLLAVIVAEEAVEEGDGGREINPWARFAWRGWARDLPRRFDRGMVLFATGLYGLFVGVTLLLFWGLPRFEFGQQLPFMSLPSGTSYSGFSEVVEFGSVIEIQEDFSVAMRVEAPVEAAASRPYWRMMVLDKYYGGGFRQSRSASAAQRTVNDFRLSGLPEAAAPDAPVWTHYFEGGVSRQVPLPAPFRELRFASRQDLELNMAVRTVSLRQAPSAMLVYRLAGLEWRDSVPPVLADRALEGEPGAMPSTPVDRYPWTTLELPADLAVQARLEAMVDALGEAPVDRLSPEERIARAIHWLQRNRAGYALSTELGEGSDPLIDWMASARPGHCELYAGGLVLLARAQGVPARLVTGFFGGVWNPFENYFMVRNADAHAWVEFYDPAVGWRRVDPTPGNGEPLAASAEERARAVLEPSSDHIESSDATFSAYLDSLRMLWYRRVVNFDAVDQRAALDTASSWGVAAWETLQAESGRFWSALREALRSPFDWALYRPLLPLLGVLLGGGGLLWAVRRLLPRLRGPAGRERLVRRQAGTWLVRFAASGAAPPSRELVDALHVLRFGPVEAWKEPTVVFRRCRRERRGRAQRTATGPSASGRSLSA